MTAEFIDRVLDSAAVRTLHNFSRPHAWRPRMRRAAFARPPGPVARDVHLRETLAWLTRAQDAVDGGGVSAAFALRRGWYPPYPETTGYIICTFFEHARESGDARFAERAARMADWLLTLQTPDGSFPGGFLWKREQPPVVFDVGQIVQGLVRAHAETGDPRYLASAVRAGDWLKSVQDADGAWRRFEYRDVPHTYEVRTAWALAQLARSTAIERFAHAARANADWARARQHANGWFEDTAFRAGDLPLTHTIAYTLEGLLETGVALGHEGSVASARLGIDALLERYEDAPRWDVAPADLVPGRLDETWSSRDKWACLTGCAQLAHVWFRMAEITRDRDRYVPAATRLLDAVCRVHDTRSSSPEVRGALAGAFPLSGAYQSFAYPNWAAKFFADALLSESRVRRETTAPIATA